MPSFSRSLEQALHRALALAGERRHEYATLEHLLLALRRRPGRGRGHAGLQRRSRRAAPQPRRLRRHRARQPGRGRPAGFEADGRLPAGDPARGDPRPVVGPRGGDGRERARRHLRRAREPRRLLPAGAGHDPLRRGQLHQPRHRQAPRARRDRGRRAAPRRNRTSGRRARIERARRRRKATPSTPIASTSTRRRRTARSTR